MHFLHADLNEDKEKCIIFAHKKFKSRSEKNNPKMV